jgi:hypothetical protein
MTLQEVAFEPKLYMEFMCRSTVSVANPSYHSSSTHSYYNIPSPRARYSVFYSNISRCSNQGLSDCTKVLADYGRNIISSCIHAAAFSNPPARPGSSRLNIEASSVITCKETVERTQRRGVLCGIIFADATGETYVKI